MKAKKTIYYILMYLPLVVSLIALPCLPEKIPAHYGFDNQVDRWGSKYEALLYPIVTILMGYYWLGMARLAAKKEEHGENNKNVIIITGLFVLILFNALNVYFLYTSFNKVENLSLVSLDIGQLVFGIVGLLMIVTGNIMPKLRRNSMIGLRTPWSMKNEITWKKCQRIGGISFIIGGIIIIGICVAMKGTPCLLSVLGVWAVLIVIDIFFTYKVAKRHGTIQ
ncbi:MAG: SdpI family protein [Bacteroidales bacterium]|nr:SdpI family protein [Lachnoclostridium sp.]MCM1384009.1 SdpI family protein [Lachnoclostridium sp.]MCM1466465.1 SdpI family protein [Bacteroidales bacterium]